MFPRVTLDMYLYSLCVYKAINVNEFCNIRSANLAVIYVFADVLKMIQFCNVRFCAQCNDGIRGHRMKKKERRGEEERREEKRREEKRREEKRREEKRREEKRREEKRREEKRREEKRREEKRREEKRREK